jgi:benzoyl-CoA reductase/2-hydroxyglutaryl-CoA dehydratase subunit BcrC/BadD/HgdB
MKTILYVSPFVPTEWIEAHGLRPHRASVSAAEDGGLGALRGVCPFARAFIEAAIGADDVAGVVATTTCDQMRHAAAMIESRSERPLFLMNVPATWQTAAAQKLYRDELERLGRFLVAMGGHTQTSDALAAMMLRYDESRTSLRTCGAGVPPAFSMAGKTHAPQSGIPLALVGGPMLRGDESIRDIVRQAGGRVVLDATEGGPRTLPAPFDRARIVDDPLAVLAEAYFAIPEVFRRPNDGLYQWLANELAAHEVRGILVWRYVWCDLWHAELHRLRQWSRLPVLEVGDGDGLSAARAIGRVEAFLESLR